MNKLQFPLFFSMLVSLLLVACSNIQESVQEAKSPEKAHPLLIESEQARPEILRQPVVAPENISNRERFRTNKSVVAETYDRAEAPSMHSQGMLHKRHDNYTRIPQTYAEPNRDKYGLIKDNVLKAVASDPISTFGIDVDGGAYANVRRYLNEGRLPVRDAVRIEELVNYFDYDYPVPDDRETPFSVSYEIAPTPWNRKTHLLHIGLKGYEAKGEMPASNLVFLLDVSGSMRSADKLPLLKSALKLLVNQLRKEDRVSIVVYAGASGVVLEPTPGDQKSRILSALDQLEAGGSTHGSAGIQLAYQLAEQHFIKDGINRILLGTDGDFNVGTVNFQQLMQLVEEKRKNGVSLSTLAFGRGNLNEQLGEQLSNRGNGTYNYIDSMKEAHKVLVREMSSSLLTIAKDVKIQIEFNPQAVSEYRLIGYVNRALRDDQFDNDAVDAGEIGAGHSVTALYEVALLGSDGSRMPKLRYQKNEQDQRVANELAFIKLRYKKPAESKSDLVSVVVNRGDIVQDEHKASGNFQFAASVAAFAQKLRGGEYLNGFSFDNILSLARDAHFKDQHGDKGEYLKLVSLAQALAGESAGTRELSSRE